MIVTVINTKKYKPVRFLIQYCKPPKAAESYCD